MSQFETSQITGGKKARHQKNGPRNNSLVVVVTKAQGLRNVLKLDKQSPYVSIRIQDQEECTRTVWRGGQTPVFNDELWFCLDGTEERILHLNVYHQGKKDAKLVCCGEVDFTTALRKSVTEGYDGWFDLYWEGRNAGKVYLEITYYPVKGEVPIGTTNPGRSQLEKTLLLPKSSDGAFRYGRSGGRHPYINDAEDEKIPELGELSQKKSRTEDLTTKMQSRTPSHSPVKKVGGFFSYSPSNKENSSHGWLTSMINNTFGHKRSDTANSIESDLSKNALKLKSPELVQDRPSNLFQSDSEDDEDENHSEISLTEKLKRSMASKQDALLKENKRIASSITYRSDNSSSDSVEEFTVGQKIDINEEMYNSPPRKLDFNRFNDDEFTSSYQSKKLPPINSRSDYDFDSDSESDNSMDSPPPPPKHTVSIGNLFDSVKSSSFDNNIEATNKLTNDGPRTELSNDLGKSMSWYEKRKSEKRKSRR